MKSVVSVGTLLLIGTIFGDFPALAGSEGFTGKVVETMDASSYTYVFVDTGTKKVWAAASKFPVKVGDTVSVPASQLMSDFHSKSLNRDFSEIYFTDKIQVNGSSSTEEKLPQGHPPIGGATPGTLPTGHADIAATTPPPKTDFTGLKPAKNGQTVEWIYAASAKLEGKPVKVRGKVVKYNAQILGKNWLHIQDGTGGPTNNDILVTTTSEAKLGDTVLVEGKVASNKDFGSGYKYALMIEDAKVTVE